MQRANDDSDDDDDSAQIVDGVSEDEDDTSVILLDNDSFAGGRGRTGSIAGMSRGSASSGGRSLKNMLGDKFKKRQKDIREKNAKVMNVPGQNNIMKSIDSTIGNSKPSTILEDDFEIDSNIDDNLSDAIQRDYDIIKIKDSEN